MKCPTRALGIWRGCTSQLGLFCGRQGSFGLLRRDSYAQSLGLASYYHEAFCGTTCPTRALGIRRGRTSHLILVRPDPAHNRSGWPVEHDQSPVQVSIAGVLFDSCRELHGHPSTAHHSCVFSTSLEVWWCEGFTNKQTKKPVSTTKPSVVLSAQPERLGTDEDARLIWVSCAVGRSLLAHWGENFAHNRSGWRVSTKKPSLPTNLAAKHV